jgi:hypothetical protein
MRAMNKIAGSVKVFFIKIVSLQKANRGQKFDEELLKWGRAIFFTQRRKGTQRIQEHFAALQTSRLCVKLFTN